MKPRRSRSSCPSTWGRRRREKTGEFREDESEGSGVFRKTKTRRCTIDVSIDADPNALFDAITSLPSNRPRPVRCCNDSVVDCFCSLSVLVLFFFVRLSGPKPWARARRLGVFVRSARGYTSERDSTRTTHLAHVTKWLNSSHNASRTSRNPRSRRVRNLLEPPERASRAQRQSWSHLLSVV